MTPAQRKLIESRDLAWLQAHGDRSITNANRAAHDRHLLLQYIRALETGAAKETPAVPESSDRQWLIRKRGYYYRPNRAGYTASIAEAGRYTEAEAKAEAAIEPAIMQAIPLSQAFDEATTSNR